VIYAHALGFRYSARMSTEQELEFVQIVKNHLPRYFSGTQVIEMGSLDINGSVRNLFEPARYVGVDLGPGPGVDVCVPAQLVGEPSGSFDCAISASSFEHNPFWLETFVNMLRLVRDGGLVLFTCASIGYREHGTRRSAPESSPLTVGLGWDYYRNLTERDFTHRLDLARWCSDWRFLVDHETYCLYFVALRGEPGDSCLPKELAPSLRERFNVWRSARAARHWLKVALFGNFLSSPPSYYLRGRR
jgi:SAM-dependent methyltransferase